MPSKQKRTPPARIRIGAVGYLNAKPLVYGLERDVGRGRFLLEYAEPSSCAARLAAGELDLALIPSIEYARRAGYGAVRGVCIATDGPAGSVLLFSKTPRERIRTVAVDPYSRTSVALLRILFREKWNADPEFVEVAPDLREMLSRHDAALLIGDRALFEGRPLSRSPDGPEVTDLGAEWRELTGLPFVFAFWAGPGDAAGTGDVSTLNESLAQGMANLEKIAETYRYGGRAHPDIALRYLRDHIRYRWGQSERDGLLRFFLLAGRHGLLEDVPEVRFFGEPVNSGVAG